MTSKSDHTRSTTAEHDARSCNVCGGRSFAVMAQRGDGVNVLECEACGMGVVAEIPAELKGLYDDGYYGVDKTAEAVGYGDYEFTAEHGLSWAAALVALLKPGGRILDIGCVDGTLLHKLPDGFERYGIEVNEHMAERAAASGVWMLGRDLLDPCIREGYKGRFDVVTAIAVFEHLADIRQGMSVALDLLKDDGVLLFEVPYISAHHENGVWFESSLEHVYYPSKNSLRHLIEEELGAYLIGSEVYIQDFASNYIGIVVRDFASATRLQRLFDRLLGRTGTTQTDAERRARQQLVLMHAAESTPGLLAGLADLHAPNRPMLQRIEQLWSRDLQRLDAVGQHRAALIEARDWHSGQAALHAAAAKDWSERYAALSATHERAIAERAELDEALNAARVRHEQALREHAARDAEFTRALDTARSDLSRGADAARTRHEQALREHAAREAELVRALDTARAQRDRLQAELDGATRSTARLESDLTAAEADRRLSLTNLSSVLEQGERQWRARQEVVSSLRQELAAVQAERDGLRQQLEQVLSSTSWKATYPLRRFGTRHGRTARLLRQGLKLAWWSARLQLPSRLREVRQRRLAASETAALPEPVADVPLNELPALAFSDQLGSAPPLVWDDEADPWPHNRPLVSVVIPCFNYGQYVAEAVDSVLAQTFNDVEVIVVEGGSTSADSRRATFALDRPRVRVIAQAGPHFVGANRNLGISQARGKYICCLDADDVLHPTYIEKAVFLLEAHGYDVVSTSTQFFGGRQDRVGILESPVLQDMLEGNHVLTCAVFRRALWRQAGGYRDTDPNVTGYVYEDWAFWTRLAALGARIINISREALFLYRSHGPSLSTRAGLHPEEVHRVLVRQINADLIGPEALARSLQAAAEPRRPAKPLRNLTATGRVSKDGRPVLLLAMPFLIVGGAERLLSRIAAGLAASGWRVLVTTSIDPGSEHGDTTRWFEPATAEIYHLPRYLAAERWEEFVRYLVASRGVDVLWIAGSAFTYDILPTLRAEFPRLRVADLLFNTVGHTANNRKHAGSIDLTFVENQEVLRFLRNAGEDEERIALVPSGVDLLAYRPGPRDPDVISLIGACEDDVVVGFSGRWSEEKDPLAFVEIARRMPPGLPVRFVMTGTGAMRLAIEQAVAAAAFPDGRFHLVGEAPDVVPYLRSYDVLVLPSRLDGRPVVALEALALGVPVVASRVGALPELVQDDVSGSLCDPGDIDAFVACLVRLVRERGRLARMKAAARHHAERHLDARAMMTRYEARLRRLLDREGVEGTERADVPGGSDPADSA